MIEGTIDSGIVSPPRGGPEGDCYDAETVG
jgi:hypothetical protein